MIYVKDTNGRYKTFRELSEKYDVPRKLIQARWQKGVRDLAKLLEGKYESLMK